MKPESIESIDELDVIKYGVIVNQDIVQVCLPNLEGVNTPLEQVEIALKKTDIGRMRNIP